MKRFSFYNNLLWVSVFAVAMAFIESAVVVYLRELYYPEGFQFPLSSIALNIAITEIIREAATIIMLLAIGVIVGKKFITRFAYFIYAFAIWDIYYYIFLKLLLAWPETLLTWDILFLIPVTWVGPVISPIILSFTMILLACCILYFNHEKINVKISLLEWSSFIIGSIILIVGFCLDYSMYLLEEYKFIEIFKLTGNEEFMSYVSNYIPREFNWPIFLFGEIIILIGICVFIVRNRKKAIQ
jgi:hypothetical protein